MTYTYATLEVGRSTYEAVKRRMREAGQDVPEDDEPLDMHGVALVPEAEPEILAQSKGEPTQEVATRVVQMFGPPLQDAGMGTMVFVFDYGEDAMMAYSSTCGREDAAAALVEWLGRQTPEVLQQAVERWKAQGILGPGAERVQ